ncbi:hypothetical protein RQP54_18345 [Curvibacter sp. APW13]|uniref:hypothetical protein n=1 Tax=Curvibacter sp. APW13 TaxID=3077236 RepID=UPI0028DFDAC6|nr:hypothetical protein [Curvibacter sp. APW13]MDT8992840.1 hypothetical protein [Curvibacter sp. APW13]
MSESMTHGTPLMALHGSVMRHDVGTLSLSSQLPVLIDHDYPVMVNPHIFGGLLDIGITEIQSQKNGLSIKTTTGLHAKLPVIPDPHRVMELRLSEGGSAVDPEEFAAWLKQAVTISKAISRHAGSAYTYRSNVFVFNSSVMVAARLKKGWPVPCTANPRLLASILAHTAADPVKAAICAESEVLVKTASGKVLRAESAESQLPNQPVDMLARYKTHTAVAIQTIPAQDLCKAAIQLRCIAEAFGKSVAGADVKMAADASGVTVQLQDNKIHFPCDGWTLGKLDVPLQSFITLSAIPTDCDEVHVVSAPHTGSPSPLIFRAGNLSFFMAAAARG